MKIIFSSLLLLFCFGAFGQGFSFDDPNVTYKNEAGKVLTQGEVMAFATQGKFGMKSEVSTDGKKVVILTRPNSEEKEKSVKASYEWMLNIRGTALPNFSFKNMDSKQLSSKGMEGNVLVLNFWFTQCKPCIEEMPALNKLVKANAGSNVAFMGLTFDHKGTVENFLPRFPFEFQVVPDVQSYIDKLKVATYPTTIIVDKQGIIRDVFVGADAFLTSKLQVAIDKLK